MPSPATVRSARRSLLLIGLLTARLSGAQQLEALWYTQGQGSLPSFLAHAEKITIVSPQVFAFDTLGNIRGKVDARMLERAKSAGVKMVPLVMNPGFDQPLMHRLLTVPEARSRAIRSLAALCRDNKFDGLQFDVENVHVSDKDAFTSFVRESVDSIHRAGCTVSAAVVPRLGEDGGPNNYTQWIHDNWRAVYDYKALADTLDFISYMTYAQHTGGSTPGPVAGYQWMEACLKYVLSLGVPPSKISLGLAGYSDYWYPSYDAKKNESRARGRDLSYTEGMGILAKRGITPKWDDVQKSPFAMWEQSGVFEHMWLEDARAFREKLGLVTKYRLRGYSVWVLGLEDPAVWDLIPVRR